jgi:large subunit ribosomal protein L7/L12
VNTIESPFIICPNRVMQAKVGLSGVDVMPQMMMGGGMPMGGMPAGGAPTTTAPVEEAPKEKEFYDLKLVGFDAAQKIKVIKEVRAITGLGLKEVSPIISPINRHFCPEFLFHSHSFANITITQAKELVEGAPKDLKKEVAKKEAEELVAKLKAVGAEVSMA